MPPFATGLMYPIWDQATRIELYSLMTFLVLSALASASELSTRGLPRSRDWLKMGLLVGLAVTVNPIHGLAAALGIGLFFIRGLLLAGVRRLGSRHSQRHLWLGHWAYPILVHFLGSRKNRPLCLG